MAYVVGSLPAYVEQNQFPLIYQTFLKPRTIELVGQYGTIHQDVKGQKTLNEIQNTYQFQADSCGFNAAGATTISQRTLTVGKCSIQQDFCFKTLNGYFTQLKLPIGSYDEQLPFEEEFLGMIAAEIGQQLEINIWQGDTASANNNVSYYDGYLKVISGSTGYVSGNTSGLTSVTAANVIPILQGIYQQIPAQLLQFDDLKIFVGADVFRTFQLALTNLNLFHYIVTTPGNYRNLLPGTNVEVIAVNGLNVNPTQAGMGSIGNPLYTNPAMVAMRISNMHIGMDLEGDETNYKMWWSPDFNAERLLINFKQGAQVAFPSEIVLWSVPGQYI